MIKEVTMYTVICDGCGKDSCAVGDFSGWNDKSYAVDCALEDNWIQDKDNHYCPDCYHYNDEDELVVKQDNLFKED